MGIFDLMDAHEHEEVMFCYNSTTDLRAIIAIHDTTLGRALGGARMWNYKTEADAVVDALRLSRSMTYQASVADCDTGGGKAVLWGDPLRDKSEAYFRAFGRFVEGLKGRFVTYADLGTNDRDLRYIRRETDCVAPFVTTAAAGTEGARVTAYGVLCGMRACSKMVFGVSSVKDRRVVVQGVGEVGRHLARYLSQEGAAVTITDIVFDAMKRVQDEVPGVEIVRPEEIFDCGCDVFSPCALGGVINRTNVDKLKCKIVAGAAYDVLESDEIGDRLHARGILYAPDFVISAGEIFQSADKMRAATEKEAFERAGEIFDVLLRVFERARREQVAPLRAAREIALERIESIGQVKTILCRPPDLGL
jgi:leucine dehydrogenase